jgi:predicted DNA-binding transcriptional regulator AlpA
MDRYLRIPDVAERTGFSPNTLRAWRKRGVGPKSGKLGGTVIYRESDVQAWIDEQLQANGTPAA